MKGTASRFLILAIVLTGICAIGQWLWNQHAAAKMQINEGFILLGIFAFVTTGIHLFMLRAIDSSGQAFVRNFMGSTTLKFFFYLMVLVVMLLYTHSNKQALIIHFLLYYFVFTVFETGMLYSELNRKKN
jgi:hypothetical protein